MKKKKFYELLREEIDRRTAVELDLKERLLQQEAVARFAESTIKAKDIGKIFDEAVLQVTQTLRVEFCKVLELLPGENKMLLRAGIGWKKGLIGSATVDAGLHSQAGLVLHSEKPVIVADLRADNSLYNSNMLIEHGVVSGMSVVIQGREHPWGVLSVHTQNERNFTEYDTRFLIGIAGILASAIERLRTEDELSQSQNELEVILNGVFEGVTAQDPTGKIIYANAAAAKVMGLSNENELNHFSTEDMLKRFELMDELGQPFPLKKLPGRQAFITKQSSSAQVRFRNVATGEEEWYIVSSAPVFNESGDVILVVNIFRTITDIIQRQKRQKLLAEAGKLFVETLQYESTMSALANLVANNLADWCTVHLVTEGKNVKQLVVAHKDPSKVEQALKLQQRYPPDWNAKTGLPRVLRTGEAEFIPEITDEILQAGARDDEHLKMLRELELHAAMVVPLVARSRVLGAITLIWAESGRRYDQEEIDLVQELANQAAIAIENATLYQEAQALNAELEQRVSMRTNQLEQTNQLLVLEIDERRKAESALRKSQAMMESLFESAPDATILVHPSGEIVQVNKQAEAIFGYERSELIGKNIEILIPKRYNPKHIENRSSYLANIGKRPMGAGLELFACRKSGEEFPVDIMLSPVNTETGVLIISSIRDITEQKRLHSELAETHRRLFESVEAERKNLSQELHDGPLQDLYGISLLLEGLRMNLHEEQSLADLDDCRESVTSVTQTLRSICGNLRPPALAHFGLGKAIRSHAARFQESHPEIKLELNLDNEGQILSDRARLALYRVYQSSLNNILRHAHATRVRIDFQVNEDRILFTIVDDGKGFRVPRRWVELAREGHFGLVGMVERIEAIGGHLSVVSGEGEGTTVQVDIPLEAAKLSNS